MMKTTIVTTMILFIFLASTVLAPSEDILRSTEDIITTQEDAVACCLAMTPDCLACSAGMTTHKYCQENPQTEGCERFLNQTTDIIPVTEELEKRLEEEKNEIMNTYRKEAEVFKNQIMATYGNDTQAIRTAYQEQAREIIQSYKGDVNKLTEEYKAMNKEELEGYVQAQKEFYAKEVEAKREQLKKKEQTILEEQNRVHVAVQSMIAMENMAGSIGENISTLAKEMNNRIKNITSLKEQAATKSGLARFFAGGDKEAARELHKQAKEFGEKIIQLEALKQETTLDEDALVIYEEQIEALKQETQRVLQEAQQEADRGLLGWIWQPKVINDSEAENMFGQVVKMSRRECKSKGWDWDRSRDVGLRCLKSGSGGADDEKVYYTYNFG
ncbi:hypothetical protein K9M74_00645 [Candidatus Woesearchaeota archaeon]|nr:hypothetical protein [Candidatus Woesearchaeota archaeon]